MDAAEQKESHYVPWTGPAVPGQGMMGLAYSSGGWVQGPSSTVRVEYIDSTRNERKGEEGNCL